MDLVPCGLVALVGQKKAAERIPAPGLRCPKPCVVLSSASPFHPMPLARRSPCQLLLYHHTKAQQHHFLDAQSSLSTPSSLLFAQQYHPISPPSSALPPSGLRLAASSHSLPRSRIHIPTTYHHAVITSSRTMRSIVTCRPSRGRNGLQGR